MTETVAIFNKRTVHWDNEIQLGIRWGSYQTLGKYHPYNLETLKIQDPERYLGPGNFSLGHLGVERRY